MIKINARVFMCCAYVYVLLPIAIFLLGWLKPYFGIPAVIFLTAAMCLAVREEKRTELVALPAMVVLIAVAAAFLWVYVSGVGGFYPQKTDWNWRNAILRDLVSYSWPVIYPETGEGLVYYLSFFLPAALTGKFLGWTAANAVMLVWTSIGITLCFLLLCKYFHIQSVRRLAAVILIFIVWREHDGIRMALANMLGASWMYEFTDHNGLLQWVTNQTVVPWICTLVFLNSKTVRNYAFLGLLLFASAPLPFAGIFCILAADGVYSLKQGGSFSVWCRQVFSIQNVLASVVLIPVFVSYYTANMAAGGDAGGIGLYMELSVKGFAALLLFWIFDSLFFGIVLYPAYKKSFLYWTTLVTLLLIPLVRVGGGRDFCMRASIPSLCIMMVLTTEYLLRGYGKEWTVRGLLLIGSLGLFTNTFLTDLINRTSYLIHAESREAVFKDAVYSLTNKLPYAECYGSIMNMYLTDDPEDRFFYSVLARTKRQDETEADRYTTEVFMQNAGFELTSGYYTFVPSSDPTGLIDHCIMLSNTTIPGKNEIYFTDIGERLAVGTDDNDRKSAVTQNHETAWGTNNIDPNQIFSVRRVGDRYAVLWNDEYALTWENRTLCWTRYEEKPAQLWKIEPAAQRR